MTKNKGLGVFCLVIYPLARHLVPNPQKKKKMCKITIFYSNEMPEKSFRLGKKGIILSHQQHFLGPIGPLPRKKIETLILIKMSQIFLTHSI